MPCPKGFKHQVVHPRPSRRRVATKAGLELAQEACSSAECRCPDTGPVMSSDFDAAWLREIGIHP